jgi:nitrogen regulation protein NR(I)
MAKAPQKLLIIDDEPAVLFSLEQILAAEGYQVRMAETGRSGLELARQQPPDVVLTDIRLPDLSGLDVHDQIRDLDPRIPVILMTAYVTTETAIEAMKRGGFEYLIKPLDLNQLRDVVRRAFELSRLSRIPAVLDVVEDGDEDSSDRVVGRSQSMLDIYKAIGRIAPQDVTVLLLGESGTGKELVARALYQHSRRSRSPFIPINCAAIPESLLESELFGHERGAFTGADRKRIGKFEQARGGTIFLDEIGDMTPATQAKVLRLLQEQQFERVGGNETITTDVRVIAATNTNLEEMVAHGKFRQDLFYRLNGFTLHLPPLRARKDDLPLLIDHFSRRACKDMSHRAVSIAADAQQLLLDYPWPGNVRELQSTVKFAIVHSNNDVITTDSLPESLRPRKVVTGDESGVIPPPGNLLAQIRSKLQAREPELYQSVHAEVDRVLLTEVLRECRGNQVEASEVLGISRNTLRSRLRMLGLSLEKTLSSHEDPGAD